jgi:NhaP-type Na+/H+ or K+/H+ antiporter
MEGASLATILALVGVVILVAALISGLIERSNLPQVAVFLALGAVLGPPGLGLLNVTLNSEVLRVVATLSLALVLFTDAVTLNVKEVRKHWTLAGLVLGPGTLLSAALMALAGWALLGLSPAAAAVIGAALASTDPVLLRGLLRRHDIPGAVRQALRMESGLNDVVLLPIVLVAMAFLQVGGVGGTDWARLLLDLFLLGPGAGVAVGLVAVSTLDLVRRRVGIRRDYEALYSLGVAFAAFAAAESLHGSGFLAAFAAGLTISALDVELCDCFLEYGETTAEMALLFTFVLFGSSLIWSGFGVLSLGLVVFALLVMLIRPVAFMLSLARTRLVRRDRLLISWFGPRGLSTLLLILLPVFAGIPGSDFLFAVCSFVVLVSVVLHGGSLMLIGRIKGPRRGGDDGDIQQLEAGLVHTHKAEQQGKEAGPPVAEPVAEPVPLPLMERKPRPEPPPPDGAGDAGSNGQERHGLDVVRITLDEMQSLQRRGEPVVVVDARSIRTYDDSDLQARGAIRIDPNQPARDAARLKLPKDAWIVAFCA